MCLSLRLKDLFKWPHTFRNYLFIHAHAPISITTMDYKCFLFYCFSVDNIHPARKNFVNFIIASEMSDFENSM